MAGRAYTIVMVSASQDWMKEVLYSTALCKPLDKRMRTDTVAKNVSTIVSAYNEAEDDL